MYMMYCSRSSYRYINDRVGMPSTATCAVRWLLARNKTVYDEEYTYIGKTFFLPVRDVISTQEIRYSQDLRRVDIDLRQVDRLHISLQLICMSCRIDQYSVLIESSSTTDVCACVNMSVSRTNLAREGKCIKFQFQRVPHLPDFYLPSRSNRIGDPMALLCSAVKSTEQLI